MGPFVQVVLGQIISLFGNAALRLVLPLVCAVGLLNPILTGRSWRRSARLPSPAASSQC